uniref:Uncharacterized protein n=1 Tax=Panagrolaimus davidi TaxID=227884 RepID=A0A914PSQ4_9BILA
MNTEHFTIGVMGLEMSGRSYLINAIKENVHPEIRLKLIVRKLDYPDNGRSQTNQQRYDEYLKEVKQQCDLSLLLLTVQDSFRDKEATLVCAARNNALSVAVVIPNFDTSLRNINRRTNEFTDIEKQRYATDDHAQKSLKDYHNNDALSDSFKNNICPSMQDESKLIPVKAASATKELPDEYDIAFIGHKDCGSSIIRNFLKTNFDRISLQKIELNDDSIEKIPKGLEMLSSNITFVVIKEKFDETMSHVLQYLNSHRKSIKIILNTTASVVAKNKFFSQCQSLVNSESIFALNLEELDNTSIEDEEIQRLFTFIQQNTGKFVKTMSNNVSKFDACAPEGHEKPCFHHDVILIGFHNTIVSPIKEIIFQINRDLDLKIVKYGKVYGVEEM